MSDLGDPGVQALLAAPHHAVLSTHAADGSIRSTVVWIDLLDGLPAVNGNAARRWCADLERDPRATVLVYDGTAPQTYVEIRGTAQARTVGAVGHDNRLAAKYRGPGAVNAAPGDRRISWLITPTRVRHHL